jgi:hypothetical protein
MTRGGGEQEERSEERQQQHHRRPSHGVTTERGCEPMEGGQGHDESRRAGQFRTDRPIERCHHVYEPVSPRVERCNGDAMGSLPGTSYAAGVA